MGLMVGSNKDVAACVTERNRRARDFVTSNCVFGSRAIVGTPSSNCLRYTITRTKQVNGGKVITCVCGGRVSTAIGGHVTRLSRGVGELRASGEDVSTSRGSIVELNRSVSGRMSKLTSGIGSNSLRTILGIERGLSSVIRSGHGLSKSSPGKRRALGTLGRRGGRLRDGGSVDGATIGSRGSNSFATAASKLRRVLSSAELRGVARNCLRSVALGGGSNGGSLSIGRNSTVNGIISACA